MTEIVQAIETRYRSILFRSRLEAKWAAFFDLLGWRWEYEPFDLNGYIPDFVLNEAATVLVEVKPVEGMDAPLFEETVRKIHKSGWENDALIVSYFLPIEYNNVGVGWLAEWMDWGKDIPPGLSEFEMAPFGRWIGTDRPKHNVKDSRLGFCHGSQSYADRITGAYDGGRFGRAWFDSREIERRWAEAGNRTQWKSRIEG